LQGISVGIDNPQEGSPWVKSSLLIRKGGGTFGRGEGAGTINGEGEYSFMLTAVDGALAGGGGADKLRMKIWDKATRIVVYDTMLGASDIENPTTVTERGSS